MALWFVFGLMTAAAVFAVLWPLGRGAALRPDGKESVVYKDQLAELDRDVAAELIAPSEAEAARVEIGRRLIASADAEHAAPVTASLKLRRVVTIAALAGLPLISGGLYLQLGSPTLGDFPVAERTRTPTASEPLDRLVAQVEAHLEKNPADGRGWDVLAPVLVKLGRFDDAARAWRNAITYNGENAARRADLGEAIAAAANGVVTAEAKTEFQRAVALDGTDVKARYFLGVAAEQDGRSAEAAAIWREMLNGAPTGAPWRPIVQDALARAGGKAASSDPAMTAPGPTSDHVVAAKDMTEADRNAMIRGMVDRLALRLKQDGADVQGWLRLVRAYMVLGDGDLARSTREDARRALGSDQAKLRELNDGLKNLGLDG